VHHVGHKGRQGSAGDTACILEFGAPVEVMPETQKVISGIGLTLHSEGPYCVY